MNRERLLSDQILIRRRTSHGNVSPPGCRARHALQLVQLPGPSVCNLCLSPSCGDEAADSVLELRW